MAEVQQHGNKYEDITVNALDCQKEYDKLKANGYTSPFDLAKGLKLMMLVLKRTGGHTVLLRMMQHRDYRLIMVVIIK